MPCTPFRSQDGRISGFVCSRGRRSKSCKCGRPSTLLCDQPLTGKKEGKTCDAPICRGCATEIGPDRHLCPVHARAAEKASVAP
jgi:hypothetical protein